MSPSRGYYSSDTSRHYSGQRRGDHQDVYDDRVQERQAPKEKSPAYDPYGTGGDAQGYRALRYDDSTGPFFIVHCLKNVVRP